MSCLSSLAHSKDSTNHQELLMPKRPSERLKKMRTGMSQRLSLGECGYSASRVLGGKEWYVEGWVDEVAQLGLLSLHTP